MVVFTVMPHQSHWEQCSWSTTGSSASCSLSGSGPPAVQTESSDQGPWGVRVSAGSPSMVWGLRGKPAPPAGGEVSSHQVLWSCLLNPSEHLSIGHKGDTKNCPAAHTSVFGRVRGEAGRWRRNVRKVQGCPGCRPQPSPQAPSSSPPSLRPVGGVSTHCRGGPSH